MKSLIALLAVSCISSCVFAQDPQLFENPWFLQKITIDGNDLFPPVDGFENLESSFNENDGTFDSGFCDFFTQPIQYENTDIFTLDDDPIYLIGFCGTQAGLQFDNDFFSVFFENRMMAKNPFNYIIEDVNDAKTLVVTNVEGGQAIFGSEPLDVRDFEKQTVSLFPNPVKEKLLITSLIPLKRSSIINVHGQVVIEHIFELNEPSISVINLSSGIYFLKTESATGQQLTVKFIKE